MNNFLDIYTRLKLKTNTDIIVTFYSSYGYKETKKFKLIDVVGFSYILVESGDWQVSIPFFGLDAMIGSITFVDSNEPIYFNPYADEEMFEGFYIKDGYAENIKNNLLGKIDFYLEEREKFIQRYKSKDSTFEYDELFFSEKQRQEFNVFFKLIIEELTDYCKKSNLDTNLNLISNGTTSIVYSIGDKIIKIGKPRRKSSIPYCEYLLQPIINRDFEFDGYPIHIEITQKVICKDPDDVLLDEDFIAITNKLKDELHAIGLKSNDLHPANIGILTTDNKINFDSINFYTGNEIATSIQNNNNLSIKRKGDFVILDLDCLEIEDVNKYSDYLRNLGFDEDIIKNINLDNNDNTMKRK